MTETNITVKISKVDNYFVYKTLVVKSFLDYEIAEAALLADGYSIAEEESDRQYAAFVKRVGA